MCPILFQLGGFSVYAYGLFIALGFVSGFILAVIKARKADVPFERVIDLFFYSLFSSVIGARLLYVLNHFEAWQRDPLMVFRIWEGGLVFYGGLLCAIAVAVPYLRWHRLPLWKIADLFSPSIALGLSLGRIGCFLAGCCYGTETPLPWSVVFTDTDSLARLNVQLHPVQLYEAAVSLVLFLVLLWMEKKKSFEGQVFWSFLLGYSGARFLLEFVRDDDRGVFLVPFLSTSQGIGILLGITSIFMLFYLKRASRR